MGWEPSPGAKASARRKIHKEILPLRGKPNVLFPPSNHYPSSSDTPRWPNPARSWRMWELEEQRLRGPHHPPAVWHSWAGRLHGKRLSTTRLLHKTERGCVCLCRLSLQLLTHCLTYGSLSNICSTTNKIVSPLFFR